MRRPVVFLLMFLAPLVALAKEPACVLPPPDGADVDWSPASLTGVLTKASAEQVELRTNSDQTFTLRILGSTQLFTVYGGGVEPTELKVGQHALVWLGGCAKPGSTDGIAVLQVCSIAAEPCPQ
jgi:hypothetical protein